jgi:hypothetical protein
MLQVLQIVTLLLVAAAWAFALAHAAEMPGKRRLDRATYFAVQRIYYPGFTIGGASEPLAILALAALLLVTHGDAVLVAIAISLAGAIAAHAVYWLVTHPINKVWLKDQTLGRAGAVFFASGGQASVASWVGYRDRWEYSHVIRTALLTVSLIALAVGLIG